MNKTMLRFRVWNNRLKVWVKGYKEAKKFFHGFCNDPQDDRNLGLSFWKVSDDYYKILKSTGIKDKKGIEIFEGDILRYNYHIQYKPEWKGSRENKDFTGVVEYHDKILKIGYESDETRFVGFILCGCKETDEEYFTTIPQLEDIEVIGNVYDNPEMLKEKKQ
jgi:uncharacterized phage protein (TIGR01671 family)